MAILLFILILTAGIGFFVRNMLRLRRAIHLGVAQDTTDHPKARLLRMLRLALGQGKMGVRPVAGILHLFVYIGFIIINIEVLEILIDGIDVKDFRLKALRGLIGNVNQDAILFNDSFFLIFIRVSKISF